MGWHTLCQWIPYQHLKSTHTHTHTQTNADTACSAHCLKLLHDRNPLSPFKVATTCHHHSWHPWLSSFLANVLGRCPFEYGVRAWPLWVVEYFRIFPNSSESKTFPSSEFVTNPAQQRLTRLQRCIGMQNCRNGLFSHTPVSQFGQKYDDYLGSLKNQQPPGENSATA